MDFRYWLSPELWSTVFQICSENPFWEHRNDIKTVRLTCKLFEELATPFLLNRICCGPWSRPLTTLTAVSLHPVLSKSVKEVVYICNQYQHIRTLLEYKEALRTTPVYFRYEEPKSDKKDLELKTSFSQYTQHYKDQSVMNASGEVIARLCSALIRMPNIKIITISPNFNCCVDDHFSGYFLEPEPAYEEAFLLMARVLSLTSTKIEELDIEADITISRNPQGMSGAVFREMSDMTLSHCCEAFRSLRKLTATHDEFDDGLMTSDFAKVLSAAIDLESLSIGGSNSASHISTRQFLRTTTWSHLATLNFRFVTFHQGELLDFLRKHSGTLKNLSLFSICLTDGSWGIFLEGMKSSLSLQAISIDDPEEGDDEENSIDIYIERTALNEYLLGDGPHPLSDSVKPDL